MNRVKARRRTNRKQPIQYFGFQTALFLTLITTSALERILTTTTFVSGWTCEAQRTIMLGDTAFHDGFYNGIIIIASIALILAPLEFGLKTWIAQAPMRSWRLPFVNGIAALGLLALCAIPWAHFNVGHPLSDRIYDARKLVAPEWPVYEPIRIPVYDFNPEVWSCDIGLCDSDPYNTESVYRHRHLGYSFRFVVYADCMSPEFNVATAKAIDANMTWFDGDRRRTERAFFDAEGRFVGPRFTWFDTPLLRSNLTRAERQSSPVSFDQLIIDIANWDRAFYDRNRIPSWTEWDIISIAILSGDVDVIYSNSGLLVGVLMKDGSELIGTQTHIDDLDRLLEECGSRCDHIVISD